ncbi:hypothetical protein F3Y22_tig00116958pilonHSYRG00038 [Hibiscus syriacus]|uniref:MHD2 domain-containing protein n=1 Tax=Hibiscus syriacus TaxID=106335 RepID=A0A6A2WXA2_HIBSY|nr:hypothetical protein F3Y22_tig00116958pilonHSYRG00038 [Hibiscus syriacus]
MWSLITNKNSDSSLLIGSPSSFPNPFHSCPTNHGGSSSMAPPPRPPPSTLMSTLHGLSVNSKVSTVKTFAKRPTRYYLRLVVRCRVYSSHDNGDGGSPGSPRCRRNNGAATVTSTSKIKRSLGLKAMKKTHCRRGSMNSMDFSNGGGGGSGGSKQSSPATHHGRSASISGFSPGGGTGFSTLQSSKTRRPLTSAEIMKQQMRVTEQSDSRLRKTLTRTLVGQMGRRPETIILPLELLRHSKPMMRLRDTIRASESNPIDSSKNSEITRTLCNTVASLACGSTTVAPADVCHWANGYPFNIHIYISLQAIFDTKDETLVLDEVDELLELMKKTWSILGINRAIHNACFTWVLFQQYVVTNQAEPDLLSAAYTMLTEVEMDARKPDKETTYVKLLSCVLVSVENWVEKRLLHYHEYFNKGNADEIENLVPMALFSAKILIEDLKMMEVDKVLADLNGDRVDKYIRFSVQNAFAKMIENENVKHTEENGGPNEALLQLAKQTEDLAAKERELFSPILKKWHPIAAGVAAVTLHQSYGAVLKQYLSETIVLNGEIVETGTQSPNLEPYAQSSQGLEQIFQEYTTFVASCGSKQSYVPSLPPLTRCSRDSKFFKLWRMANPCSVEYKTCTNSLPLRNTILAHQQAAERNASMVLKQNLSLLTAILTDRAQALAMKEVMKACFEAFLLVLLAGGHSSFTSAKSSTRGSNFDQGPESRTSLLTAILTDRAQALAMKEVMKACFEAFFWVDTENVVKREAEPVEGVIMLMGQTTEQLAEDLSVLTCESNGIDAIGSGQKLRIPPTIRWDRGDPNTILRVLCHRNDREANLFLKRSFQLAKRN